MLKRGQESLLHRGVTPDYPVLDHLRGPALPPQRRRQIPSTCIWGNQPGDRSNGSTYFTLFYLVGQVFNAFLVEIIFRGLMLPHFMRRFSFWKANILQAFLFGLAHLVFPLSSWVRGQAARRLAGQLRPCWSLRLFGGLVLGYLYYRTGNLWTAVFAHLIDNVVGLFFHIQTGDRLNAETDVIVWAASASLLWR